MVSALDSRASSLGDEPWPGTFCCVLGQDTLLSNCLSPPRCINEYWRIVGEPNKLRGSDLRWTSILSSGSRNTSIAASCHRNLDKLR